MVTVLSIYYHFVHQGVYHYPLLVDTALYRPCVPLCIRRIITNGIYQYMSTYGKRENGVAPLHSVANICQVISTGMYLPVVVASGCTAGETCNMISGSTGWTAWVSG